jgi:hypothetical protein
VYVCNAVAALKSLLNEVAGCDATELPTSMSLSEIITEERKVLAEVGQRPDRHDLYFSLGEARAGCRDQSFHAAIDDAVGNSGPEKPQGKNATQHDLLFKTVGRQPVIDLRRIVWAIIVRTNRSRIARDSTMIRNPGTARPFRSVLWRTCYEADFAPEIGGSL